MVVLMTILGETQGRRLYGEGNIFIYCSDDHQSLFRPANVESDDEYDNEYVQVLHMKKKTFFTQVDCILEEILTNSIDAVDNREEQNMLA